MTTAQKENRDYFSGHSKQYAGFRPRYPAELYEFVLGHVQKTGCAWDCGTGNGQVAVELARHFTDVYATDISAAQIAQAPPVENIRYRVSGAESTPISAGTCDLITAGASVHWFDLDAFYAEIRRVAVSGCVVAFWAYDVVSVDPAIDLWVSGLYRDIVGPYWPAERRQVESRYADLPFPFREISAPGITMRHEWTAAEFLGYLETWSSVQLYRKANGENPMEFVTKEISDAWGSGRRTVMWPMFMRVGRVFS